METEEDLELEELDDFEVVRAGTDEVTFQFVGATGLEVALLQPPEQLVTVIVEVTKVVSS